MCGFAGFLSFGSSGQPVHQRRAMLQAMGDAIAHRGPDDAQYLVDGPLSLVFRRLSILDLDTGRQPIANETGNLLIAANAEIYNHAELRRELQGRHAFTTRSDCEAPLHAFEEWGDAAVERLRGMFALALWDRRLQRLVLARDRLGIKPLYICRLPGGLLFGSELKALLAHPDCPRELDWQALDRTMGAQPAGTSYVCGVQQLAPATLMSLTPDGRCDERVYWRIEDHFGVAPFGHDAAAYVDRYADLLEQATHEHLQRDVGAGLLLSGGVDSSLIAAIAARSDRDLPCFTVVEHTTLAGGDVEAARRLTDALGLAWHPIAFDHRRLAQEMDYGLDRFEQDVWMMDSPRFDLEWVFKSELHRAARATCPGLKVMLLGQGADEFAGGYSSQLGSAHGGWDDYLRHEVDRTLRHADAQRRGGRERLWTALRPDATAAPVAPYHRMMSLHVRQLQHHNLWHEDRSSSRHSLEARVPFLDHRLVELLASVPQALHAKLFWRKSIVRDALRRFAPGIQPTQAKIGFIDAPDKSSRNLIERALLLRCYDDFRDRYLHATDGGFDPAAVDAVAHRVRRCGPTLTEDLALLGESMAVAVFQRQLRSPRALQRPDARAPVLPTVTWPQWPGLLADMAGAPVPSLPWRMTEHLRLRDDVKVFAAAQRGDSERFCMTCNGALCGELEVAGSSSWVGAFLRNLGSTAASGFTVQDWADEFDLAPPELLKLLDMLSFRGVIEPAEADPAHGPSAQGAVPRRDLSSGDTEPIALDAHPL